MLNSVRLRTRHTCLTCSALLRSTRGLKISHQVNNSEDDKEQQKQKPKKGKPKRDMIKDLLGELEQDEQIPTELTRRNTLSVEGRLRNMMRQGKKVRKISVEGRLGDMLKHIPLDASTKDDPKQLGSTGDSTSSVKVEDSLDKSVSNEDNMEASAKIMSDQQEPIADTNAEIIKPKTTKKKSKKTAHKQPAKETMKPAKDGRDVSLLMESLLGGDSKKDSISSIMGSVKFVEEIPGKTDSMKGSKERGRRRLSLTHGETLGLFDGVDFDTKVSVQTFTSLHEKQWYNDLNKLLPALEPQNAFEEAMLNMDKEWKFPIDNDQDFIEEEDVNFEDHVFLDHLLDEFPDEGPVRSYMELVVTGLQQNPYLTVQQKEERVQWYKEYFSNFSEEDLEVSL